MEFAEDIVDNYYAIDIKKDEDEMDPEEEFMSPGFE